ncbi:hypothetical protein PRUPE_3G153800 [Prunus persica]|uniref:PGG domain-containing protein n=1 Tax=Prunus persica TaxID=3760 RepID=A0A251Q0J2_PRUPE|nr:protein ACCELERATED CELL DEATH 6 isoform X1 [Prunus persica]ONI17357.1 hypothetical protein PRUPE_3G153800 [Prunus persica]
MDAKLVADKQIGRDDIMEEHNVTKSIHQRLAEPFKLQQQGGDFEGAIQDLVEFDHKVESTHQGIAFGPSVLDGSAITGPEFISTKKNGRDYIMEEQSAEPFKFQQQGGDSEGAIQALVNVESTHQSIAIGPNVPSGSATTGHEFISTKQNGRNDITEEQSAESSKLQQQGGYFERAIQHLFKMFQCIAIGPPKYLGSATTGPKFSSNKQNGHDDIAIGPSVPLAKQTVGDEDLRLGSATTGPKFSSNKQKRLGSATTGPKFSSNKQNGRDDIAIGPSVPLAKQTIGDEDLRLYQQLYGYASQGKIDSFINTIESKLKANAPDRLLSRLNPHNNTLLHIAAKFGHAKLAAKILQHHKPLLFETNSDRDTALHIVAKAGDLDTTNTLLREAQSHDVFILLTTRNNEQNTPLHEALIHGHQSVAKCLIEAYHVLRFDCNKERKSTLYLAAEEGFAEIVKLIQKKAFEQNIQVHVHGKSPLHGAILGRRNKELLEIISRMEETFQSPKDEKDRTPLHCAASIGYMEGVRFLLERHLSDSHQVDHRGNFPIHSASSEGHVKIVKELLRHCPDSTEYRNYNFENILHVAARRGKDNVVKYFLKNGEFQMLINQKDSNGNTPLHLATKHHHPKVVYRLAWHRGTNLKLLNGRGETALDITESNFGTIDSYHGSLTWTILKSAFAQPAQSLHVLQWWRSPQVADNGGDHHEERFKDKVNAQNLHVQSRKQRSTQVAGNGGDHHEERFKDRVNALLVVATLVATVAFAAGFTMPGGNNDSAPHEGMAILLTKAMFQTFVICNTIAMYTATLVAVSLIWAQLEDINLVYNALRLALPLLGIALTMMSLAFMAGVYVVVSNLHWLAYVVLILGVLFIFTVLVVFTPLFCNTTSRFYILRRITYFLFCVEVWASGSHKKDQKED